MRGHGEDVVYLVESADERKGREDEEGVKTRAISRYLSVRDDARLYFAKHMYNPLHLLTFPAFIRWKRRRREVEASEGVSIISSCKLATTFWPDVPHVSSSSKILNLTTLQDLSPPDHRSQHPSETTWKIFQDRTVDQ